MLHLADAAQHLGRTGEALDWLSRALRIARGSDLEALARANSSRKWIPEFAKNQIFRGFWMISGS